MALAPTSCGRRLALLLRHQIPALSKDRREQRTACEAKSTCCARPGPGFELRRGRTSVGDHRCIVVGDFFLGVHRFLERRLDRCHYCRSSLALQDRRSSRGIVLRCLPSGTTLSHRDPSQRHDNRICADCNSALSNSPSVAILDSACHHPPVHLSWQLRFRCTYTFELRLSAVFVRIESGVGTGARDGTPHEQLMHGAEQLAPASAAVFPPTCVLRRVPTLASVPSRVSAGRL